MSTACSMGSVLTRTSVTHSTKTFQMHRDPTLLGVMQLSYCTAL